MIIVSITFEFSGYNRSDEQGTDVKFDADDKNYPARRRKRAHNALQIEIKEEESSPESSLVEFDLHLINLSRTPQY